MLNRLALRLITVQALRGRTLVGAKVIDSDMAPIEEIAAAKPAPVIVVYTDDGHFSTQSRDLFATAGDSRVDVGYQHLVIETAVTQRMQILDDDGNLSEQAVQPATDGAIEFNVDLISRQIRMALMDPRPEAVWADLWRRWVLDIGDQQDQRGSSNRDGVRLAGRQIRLSVRMLREPVPGAAIGPVWARFLELSAASADLAPLVPILTSALAGDELPEWRQTMGAYGLSTAEARALLIAPPLAAETTSPSFLTPVVDDAVPVPHVFGPPAVTPL